MASYNRVIIMGNLTRDPEYKQLSSGLAVCRLGIASNRQFRNKQTGQLVQEVCFVDVDIWGSQAESCSQYLVKGRAVLVEGRLKLDTWQDNDGQKRSKHSIIADRVTFLSQQSQDELGEEAATQNSDARADGRSNVNEDASAGAQETVKVEPAQSPAPDGASAPAPQESGEKAGDRAGLGEVNFKDQKPFEDDLPF